MNFHVQSMLCKYIYIHCLCFYYLYVWYCVFIISNGDDSCLVCADIQVRMSIYEHGVNVYLWVCLSMMCIRK